MHKVPIAQLKINTYYTSPLFWDGYIILYPNLPITEDLLNRLNQWHCTEVETSGWPSESIPSLKMDPFLESVVDSRGKVFKKEGDGLRSIESVLSRVYSVCRGTEKIDVNAFFEFAKDFRAMIAGDLSVYLTVPISDFAESDYLIAQSVRTAVLAFAVSEALKIPLYRQLELITAALLHKIGMVKIPKIVYLKEGTLSEKETELIRYYPVLGARILKANGFSNEVIQGVLEHQEAYDGSGYPQHLVGEGISLFGRILNVTSSFCAMTAFRPYRSEIKNESSSILKILKGAKKEYDPNICRTLLGILSLYPIGTMVLLANNSVAVAVKVNPDNPKAPYVKLLTDSSGKPVMNEQIFDTQRDDFQIVRVLTDDEAQNVKNLFAEKRK